MVEIHLRTAITIDVADHSGVEHEYKLEVGRNEVPSEVADHWYVKKFIDEAPVTARRTVMPSAALTAATMARVREAAKGLEPASPCQPAPAPPLAAAAPAASLQPADVPAAEKPEKAKP